MVQARSEATTPALFEFPPPPGIPIGRRLTLLTQEGMRAVFLGPVPINVYDASDRAAEAACMAMLVRAGLARRVDVAEGFGVHRNTVGRLASRLAEGGLGAVVPAKRGPKGPSKASAEVRAVVAASGGVSSKRVAEIVLERTGVRISAAHVRRLRQSLPSPQQALDVEETSALTPPSATTAPDVPAVAATRSPQVPAAASGEDTLRHDTSDDTLRAEAPDEDALHAAAPDEDGASVFDPPAAVPSCVRGRYMGVALYFPALAVLGLLDAARRLFRLPHSERFGVRAVFLTLFFLTLLHKPTVESAKHLVRRSFGALVGTGRAPCVKTLRRKLAELAVQSKAAELGRLLARRWVDAGLVATAYLYVDGHVKAYAGKQKVQEVWNSQRRMPLPGVLTYFVGDGSGRPLLFVTDEVHPSLAKSMRRIVQAIREVLGERGFTVVFDRGGYNGRLFVWLHEQGIGFITYQRGSPNLPADRFSRHETRFEGKRVRFKIAEDQVKVGRSGPWRRIVVRTKTGHQTPILTGLPEEQGGPARIACLMFARWRQENFFRYMAEHHGLDQLCSYATEPAPDQLVPNPERKRLQRELGAKRKQAAELRARIGDALVSEPKTGRSAHGLKIAQGGTVKTLRILEQEIAQLEARHKACPTHVPLSASGQARKVFRLEQKTIVDRIKVCAYNTEEWLLDLLGRHYPNTHDIRDLLRSFADLPGEMRSTPEGLVVTLDPPDTPQHRNALRGLCQELNTIGATYPGTRIPVIYQVGVHHSQAAS
ncbi:MAG: hypothetical protein QME77_11030 [bacterium]|nr:hypothetical protein [bacterium]